MYLVNSTATIDGVRTKIFQITKVRGLLWACGSLHRSRSSVRGVTVSELACAMFRLWDTSAAMPLSLCSGSETWFSSSYLPHPNPSSHLYHYTQRRKSQAYFAILHFHPLFDKTQVIRRIMLSIFLSRSTAFIFLKPLSVDAVKSLKLRANGRLLDKKKVS